MVSFWFFKECFDEITYFVKWILELGKKGDERKWWEWEESWIEKGEEWGECKNLVTHFLIRDSFEIFFTKSPKGFPKTNEGKEIETRL